LLSREGVVGIQWETSYIGIAVVDRLWRVFPNATLVF
jgi:hypothetical protein